jgi:hypothetical protein
MDLPMHRDCSDFALRTCPYLAMPKYLGRKIAVPNPENVPEEARLLVDETQDPARPEVFVSVGTDRFLIEDRPPMTPLFKPLPPWCGIAFWRHGKQLSERGAMPYLKAVFGVDWELPLEKLA